MFLYLIPLHPFAFAIIVSAILLTTLFITFICIYLYVHRSYDRRRAEAAIAEKGLIYSSPASMTSNRFVFPLLKLSNADSIGTNTESTTKIIRETFPQLSMNELPTNYNTFDLAKRYRQQASSDSSYASSINRHSKPQSFSFGTIKSKFQQVHSPSVSNSSYPYENINSEQMSTVSSDSDDRYNESFASTVPSFEYSLTELFRIELVYKLYYSTDDNQLLFQIVRLIPMQILIEQCFSSLICKIRLFTNNDKRKTKKYFSKKDPINELFKFDLDQFNFEKSYLKLHILGQHNNDKYVKLGQTVLVINQYNHCMIESGHLSSSEQYVKSIQIYEDRIDMIIRQQVGFNFYFF